MRLCYWMLNSDFFVLNTIFMQLPCRSPCWPGCVWGACPRVRSPAVWLHAGPRGHLHYFTLLVPHTLPVCHAVRERGGGGGLFLLRWHQSYLSAGALRPACQHPQAAELQGRRGGHDCSGEVRFHLFSYFGILTRVFLLCAFYLPVLVLLIPLKSLADFLIILGQCLLSRRYLDSVTNKDSTLPPIPHLHSLLTDNGEPHPEVDIFKLVRSSYEVLILNCVECLETFVCLNTT